MKFTPGPWFLKRESTVLRGAAMQVRFSFFALTHQMKQISADPNYVHVTNTGTPLNITAYGAASERDAFLASKAPVLLECLQNFLELQDGYLSKDLEPDHVKRAREVVKELKGGRHGKKS